MEWQCCSQGIHRNFTPITANLRILEARLQNKSRHFAVIGVHLRFSSPKLSAIRLKTCFANIKLEGVRGLFSPQGEACDAED
jgi:hypothetical protein